MEISNLPQEYGRLNWLAERRKGIGGSDVAPILGLSKWEDQDEWSVYLRKRNEAPEKERTMALDLGQLLEPVVTTLYERRTGRECFNPKALVQHGQHPELIGSPDRLIVGERRGLEIKTALWIDDELWGSEGTDHVPIDYLLQCAHYMAVCDIDVWDLGVLFLAAREFRLYTLHRDLALEADLVERLTRWWNLRMVQGIEPDPGASLAYGQHLQRLYPKHVKDKSIAPTQEFATQVIRLHKAKTAKEEWEVEERRAQNLIKSMLGDAQRCRGPNWSVSWTAQKERQYTDWETIARELGDHMENDVWDAMVAQHTKDGAPIRALRLHVSKGL